MLMLNNHQPCNKTQTPKDNTVLWDPTSSIDLLLTLCVKGSIQCPAGSSRRNLDKPTSLKCPLRDSHFQQMAKKILPHDGTAVKPSAIWTLLI